MRQEPRSVKQKIEGLVRAGVRKAEAALGLVGMSLTLTVDVGS